MNDTRALLKLRDYRGLRLERYLARCHAAGPVTETKGYRYTHHVLANVIAHYYPGIDEVFFEHMKEAPQVLLMVEKGLEQLHIFSPETFDHTIYVAALIMAMVSELEQQEPPVYFSDQSKAAMCASALGHDFGKLFTKDAVLHKRGGLEEKERQEINDHVAVAAFLFERLDMPDWLRKEMTDMIGDHHEMLDGTGYPRQLVAEDISTAARIIAIADKYEALTGHRSYKDPLDVETASGILSDLVEKGKVDPQIFRTMLSVVQGQLFESKRVSKDLDEKYPRGPARHGKLPLYTKWTAPLQPWPSDSFDPER